MGESGEKTELSGLRLRVRIVPEVRGGASRCHFRSTDVFGFMYRPCSDRVVRRAPSAAHVQHVPLNGECMVYFRREHGIQRLTSAKLILLARRWRSEHAC